jgi:hypothetical protein
MHVSRIAALFFAFLTAIFIANVGPAAAKETAAKETAGKATPENALVLEDWFRGRTTARGSFFNAIDGSRRDLVVDLVGTWDKRTQTLTLVEDFFYSDGERDRKTWRFTKTGPGTYVGRREDVIGTARIFTDSAGKVRLQYKAMVGGRTLAFDDTLALRTDGTVLNTASVSYLFISVGRVELVFNRGGRKAAS